MTDRVKQILTTFYPITPIPTLKRNYYTRIMQIINKTKTEIKVIFNTDTLPISEISIPELSKLVIELDEITVSELIL